MQYFRAFESCFSSTGLTTHLYLNTAAAFLYSFFPLKSWFITKSYESDRNSINKGTYTLKYLMKSEASRGNISE